MGHHPPHTCDLPRPQSGEPTHLRGHPRPPHTGCGSPGPQPSPASADVAVPPGTRVNTRWTAQPGVREYGPGNTITAPTRPTHPHRMCVLRPATTVVTSSP